MSYLDPPPPLDLSSLVTVPLSDPSPYVVAAVVEAGVVVLNSATKELILIDRSGSEGRIPLQLDNMPFTIIGGPRNVVYAFAQAGTESAPAAGVVFAIPITGDQRGQAVASAEIGMVSYVNTRTGAVPLPYVDSSGQRFDTASTLSIYLQDESGNIGVLGQPPTWALEIERHPEFRGSYVGDSPPVTTSDGGAIAWTAVGAPSDPNADFPDPLLPVVAMLHPDGSGTWRSIPDGWIVSEMTNIVFAITNATDQVCAATMLSAVLGISTDGMKREASRKPSSSSPPTSLAPGEPLYVQVSAIFVVPNATCVGQDLLSSVSFVLANGITREFELAEPLDATCGFFYEVVTAGPQPSLDCSWIIGERPRDLLGSDAQTTLTLGRYSKIGTCQTPTIVAVLGVNEYGTRFPAQSSGSFDPLAPAPDLTPFKGTIELALGTSVPIALCNPPQSRMIVSIEVTLSVGSMSSTVLDQPLDVGCGFFYDFGVAPVAG